MVPHQLTFTSWQCPAESLTQTTARAALPGASASALDTRTAWFNVSEAQSKFNLSACGLLHWPYRISSQHVWQETTEKSKILRGKKKKKKRAVQL